MAKLSETVSHIAAAMDQQGAATQEIGGAVAAAARTTDSVAQSMDAALVSANGMDEATGRLSTSVDTLFTQSEALERQVSGFLERISR